MTLQCLNTTQPNYGKFEIVCQNEHHVLRRYIESTEDLTDNYTIEFFTFDELYSHIYHYKQNFDKNNGRITSIDYLLISIRIIQPLQVFDALKKLRPMHEPTVITLNTLGKARPTKDSKEKVEKAGTNDKNKTKNPTSQENSIKSLEDLRTVSYTFS